MSTAVEIEKKTISVIIIEDFKLTRVGLRCALNSNEDINVVAESDNATDGLELIRRFKLVIFLKTILISDLTPSLFLTNFPSSSNPLFAISRHRLLYLT